MRRSAGRESRNRAASTCAIGIVGLALVGCQTPPVQPSASAKPGATAPSVAGCRSTPAPGGPQVLLRGQPAPDDLAFDTAGRLLFTDIMKGTLSRLEADGSVQQLASGLSEPEGIVVQKDGRILVAEQGHNRIVAIDAPSHTVTPWRAFINRTANAGIDGIGPILPEKDANSAPLAGADDVIVPDSPNGLVWEVTSDGRSETQIASGMTRPVGAAIDARHRIFVADEGGALWVLDPAKHRFTTLPTPDDVLVASDGHIFVNTLGDNAIHELDAQGHELNALRGIAQPQGIALDGADNLYYTEFSGGRIDRVVRTFVLDAPIVTRIAASTYLICPAIHRARGFAQPLSLIIGNNPQLAILRIVQPGSDSSGVLQVKTSQAQITISVQTGQAGQPQLSVSQTVPLRP